MNCKTITIFSNKGGVGKTFITTNMATSLAVAGYKVLLIDLDLQAGQDMARMMNLSPRGSIVDTFSALEGENTKGIVKQYAAAHRSGLDFIPAVKSIKQIGHMTPESIKPFFKRVQEDYDFIIVDGGQAFSETLITVLDNSNLILLVATPDVLAVYQLKRCMEVLQDLHFPIKMIKLILNRSESRGSVAWQEVRSALPCEIFGHVPSDGKLVGMALNRGIPCVMDSPKSKVTDAFVKMTNMLRQENMFVSGINIDRSQSSGELTQKDDFWKKFGISQVEGSVDSGEFDEALILFKARIHERLIDRLNADGITTESLNTQEAIIRVKKMAEEIVGGLIMEESEGKNMLPEERELLIKDVVNEALGLGPLEYFLADPDVSDIMVNNRNQIYVEKSGKLILTNKQFVSDDKMRSIIDRIIAPLGRRIDESTPMVDARLPDGSRVNAIIPPLSLGGPMITIRKFAQEKLESEDLITKYGSLTQDMADFLKACVLGRQNIIVSGGTGAGKTTLLNVISEFIPDNERIITIEDAAELRLKKSHVGRLESRPSNVEGKGQITIRDLFVNCLRMRPDRIIIGECRGGEVLDMLQAMNTGHDGSMTTLHANSTRDAITRLNAMILLSGVELPVRAINEMISSAIQVIVQVNRFSDGTRKITGISETLGLDDQYQLILEDIFRYKQSGIDEHGKVVGEYTSTGYIPSCYDEFVTRGFPIDKSMFVKE